MGVSTSRNVYHEEPVAQTGRVFYEGCQWLPLRRALRRVHPRSSDVFVDLGAGKGQALLIAGRSGYGTVIGVEVDPDLAGNAASNIDRARHRLRAPIVEIVNADALDWGIPDDTTTVFMFCPFLGELFHAVLEGVFASYDRRPRDLHLVYDFPFEHNWLLSTGRLQVESVLPGRWPARPGWWRTSWVIITYRVTSPSGGATRRTWHGRGRPMRRWAGANDHRFWVGEPGGEKVYSTE
jgi:SAM-dependent methyltransferase